MDTAQLPAPTVYPPRGMRERLCVSAVFFLIGFVFSSWVPYIPAMKARFQMSDGHLGGSLLLIGLGALSAMLSAPTIMRRLRNRRALVGAVAGLAATFCLVLGSQSLAVFYAALLAFGFVNGLCNVAINAQGADFERSLGRPVMSSFHAFFSIGGFCGAALTYLLLRWNLGEPVHTGIIGVSAVAALCASAKWLPADLTTATTSSNGGLRLSTNLCAIAVIALIALAVEGSITDWLTVYLQRAFTNAIESAALGFVVFSGAMTLARLLGDRLKVKFGCLRVFQLGLIIATGGFFGLVMADQLPLAYVCIFMTGIGLGNLVPIVFSQAGNIPGVDPTKAITAVSVAGYLGYLGSPPLVGYLSDLAGLRWALLALVPLMLVIFAVGARQVK